MSDMKHQEDVLLLDRDDVLQDDDDLVLSEESEAEGLVVEDEAEELLLTEPDDEGEGNLGVIVGETSPSEEDQSSGVEDIPEYIDALARSESCEAGGKRSPGETGKKSGPRESWRKSSHSEAEETGSSLEAGRKSNPLEANEENDPAEATTSEGYISSGTGENDRSGQGKGPQTKVVVGVRFRSVGKSYYFAVGDLPVKRGSHVIVETARGLDFGTSVCDPMELDRKQFKAPVKRIVRLATAADENRVRENREKEHEAYRICYEKIRRRELDMKLIQAEYAFDGSKILFYFTADERVDFRDLVKDLAGVFHTRIELRQIGVRDETRILGGCGICGRPLCCHTYLTDFAPVSIKMAKEQNLSLNPAKISGTCGRLMCCLKNEEEVYEELNGNLPKPGDEVEGSDGLTGEVAGVDILRQLVRILVEVDDEKELHEYPADEITILRRRKRGQAKPKINRSELRDARSARRGAPAGAGRAADSGASGEPEHHEHKDRAEGQSAGRREGAGQDAAQNAVNAAAAGEQIPASRGERPGRRTRQDSRGERSARSARASRSAQEGSLARGADLRDSQERAARSAQEGSAEERVNARAEGETASKRRESPGRTNVSSEGPAESAGTQARQPGESGGSGQSVRRRRGSRQSAGRQDRPSQARGENLRAMDSRGDGAQGQEMSAAGAEPSEKRALREAAGVNSQENVTSREAAGADSPEKMGSRESVAGRQENASSRTRHRRNRRRGGTGTGTGTGADTSGGSGSTGKNA